MNSLSQQIVELLERGMDRDAALQQALHLVLADLHSETGTIHHLNRKTQQLHLAAQIGLPPAMLDIVKLIPVGKGIAGQTVERGGPVSMCNLQRDTSGTSRAGARQTGVAGALCVPLWDGDTIVGTIGVGTIRAHEYTPEETRALEAVGQSIGRYLSGAGRGTGR